MLYTQSILSTICIVGGPDEGGGLGGGLALMMYASSDDMKSWEPLAPGLPIGCRAADSHQETLHMKQ